jgi:hypothetical protein
VANLIAPIRSATVVRLRIHAQAAESFAQALEGIEVAELRVLGLSVAPFREVFAHIAVEGAVDRMNVVVGVGGGPARGLVEPRAAADGCPPGFVPGYAQVDKGEG